MLLLLLACSSAPDSDYDGAPDASDCAPTDPRAAPGSPETCDGVDEDCDGQVDEGLPLSTFYADGDGDGWGGAAVEACAPPPGASATPGDCDDADPWTYPGAVEACDGADQDCDGEADDDALDANVWFADADGDTWGDGSSPTTACTSPDGTVGREGDCDDADAAVRPNAAEVCDGADNDCDGLVDDADPEVGADPDTAGATRAWADLDGDGWGGEAVALCAPGEGFTSTPGDCDDADASSHPGAPRSCADDADHDCDGRPDSYDGDGDGIAECADCDDADATVSPAAPEVCNGQDDDCDGVVDPPDAVDATPWYPDADADGFGVEAGAISSCEMPVGFIATPGDCNDDEARVNPGARENCRTDQDDDCDGTLDAVDAAGCSFWYADADGDGYGDPTVGVCACESPGAPYTATVAQDCDDTMSSFHPGVEDACLDGIDLNCDGDDACDVDELPVVALGEKEEERVGASLLPPLDVTGDGVADVIAGAAAWSIANSGAVVHAGPLGPDLAVTARLGASGGDWYLGEWIVGADTDGDGIGDIGVGSYLSEAGGVPDSGAVEILRGPFAGDRTTASADLLARGDEDDELGWSAALGPDVDGDGGPDLVVGGFYGAMGGYVGWDASASGVVTPSDASWTMACDAASGICGHALATGDVDGDGAADLVYGLYGTNRTAWRAGPLSGSLDPAEHDGSWTLDDADEYVLGIGIGLVDDLDGDGLVDLTLAGDSKFWYFGRAPAGDVDTSDATAAFPDSRSFDSGAPPLLGVDLDADGRSEAVVGYPQIGRGTVYVFPTPLVGTLTPGDARVGWEGSGAGMAIVAAGDVDGDGREDALVGAPDAGAAVADSAGAVLLLPGSALP